MADAINREANNLFVSCFAFPIGLARGSAKQDHSVDRVRVGQGLKKRKQFCHFCILPCVQGFSSNIYSVSLLPQSRESTYSEIISFYMYLNFFHLFF